MSNTVKNAKIYLLAVLIFLGLLVVVVRFAYIQLFGRTAYIERIVEKFPKAVVEKVPVYRGAIKDRKGVELAISMPTFSIFAFPKSVQNKEELARRLSAILDQREEEILKKLNTDSKFVWLARNIDKEYINYVRGVIRDTQNQNAVGVQEDYKRVYPHGYLASNLIGFVGADGRGLEGIEYMFDHKLYSKEAKKVFLYSPKGGRLVLNLEEEERDYKTQDLQLTIDFGVQVILEDIKEKIVKDWSPRRIAIIVINLQTGDILGLANYPHYDPNHYQKVRPENRRNYAVTDPFEPGSAMKPFFIGQALEKGYIGFNYSVDTEGGRAEFFGRTIRDVHPYRVLSLDQVLIKSSNVGTAKVARFFSKKDVEELFEKIHFKSTFGVLPGEAKPKLPNLNYPANIIYASIGQGLSANLLNLCVAFGGLATNQIIQPRIVYEPNSPPKVLRDKLFSDKVLDWLHKNLIKVVEEGTATQARSQYFTIAGKTGTAQKFDFKTGKYSMEKVVAYFVGYFPATNPKYVAGIMVDEPKGRAFGGTAAAPYFKELVERVAFYERLEPDKTNKAISEGRLKN
ncbi:penicillin-binding protein 2 [Thermocrinis sp.]|jgi:cell division protein FtsI (penicillin-binding protein 3)|uniref:peptidoglycan D,D-transpeptidase FtsI family protein n=1 Tax=Thermocrinis sp. TaxID=2024383 RepID=UPI0026253406|nr:penicillin-binding protein 2 [Thermocrinis sp.]